MSQYQPVAGGELPPALQYQLERNLMAVGVRSRPDAPPFTLGRFCVFMSAGMLAIALATILVTFAATLWIMPLDEDETYRPPDDGGGGSSDPRLPVYRETVKPEPRTVHLPTSLRKARPDNMSGASA
ncbi:hypothetical protein MTO96_038053, partial [Rhipicephalus appendiculatus]